MNVILVLISLFAVFIGVSLSRPEIPVLKGNHAYIGNNPAINMEKCGYISPKDINSGGSGPGPKSRIINGELASLGEFPWQASILHKFRDARRNILCDGVLIHKYWVLTVKHCMTPRSQTDPDIIPRVLNVSFGTLDARVLFEVRNVSEIVRHPHDAVDVALLHLETPMEPLSSADGSYYRINQICVPHENVTNFVSEEAILSGFGASMIIPNPLPGATPPSVENTLLRKAIINIDSEPECRARGYPYWNICAPESEHMTCNGDSGSGLVQFDGKRGMVIGTVLAGYKWDLNDPECSPGVLLYLRISHFIQFLRDVIEFGQRFEPKPRPTQPTKAPNPGKPVTTKGPDDPDNDDQEQEHKEDESSGSLDILRADKTIALNAIIVLINIFIH